MNSTRGRPVSNLEVAEAEDSFSNAVASIGCLQRNRYSRSNRKLANRHSNLKTAAVKAKGPVEHAEEEVVSTACNGEMRRWTKLTS